jgi:CheY-like chemotaxis protein
MDDVRHNDRGNEITMVKRAAAAMRVGFEPCVLIADDDPVSRTLLTSLLQADGYEVKAVADGAAAWDVLQQPNAPALAVLDWMMPGVDGPELCRRVRGLGGIAPPYLLLLTARDGSDDVVEGLASGADDYVTKPFDRAELRARLQVGCRVLALQQKLTQRVRELESALARVKQLQGLLPMCCYCKKIRDDQDYWQLLETFVTRHSSARFSHGICPECYETIVKPKLGRP